MVPGRGLSDLAFFSPVPVLLRDLWAEDAESFQVKGGSEQEKLSQGSFTLVFEVELRGETAGHPGRVDGFGGGRGSEFGAVHLASPVPLLGLFCPTSSDAPKS